MGNVGRYVGLRRGEYWERRENSEYYCGGCGWKVTDHDSYCPECGGSLHSTTAVPTAKRVRVTVDERGTVGRCMCSACGGKVDQDDAFCRHCGKELT